MTRDQELHELRRLLRSVMQGMWRHRRPRLELDVRLGRRHVGVLMHVAAEGPQTVGRIAHDVGLSLPATSKLVRELADAGLVERREDEDDRRRTVVELSDATAAGVRTWMAER